MKKCYFPADILLPDFGKTDARKWAVVACDQFTSERQYWEETARIAGDAPSTLNLILPEVYLAEAEERIPKINAAMKEYADTLLCEYPDSLIYVERTQSDGTLRRGLILAVDLEAYDFSRGASSLIRATEATVIERIPPRVKIRRDAPLELPHIMLLIDDPKRSVIEPISSNKEACCPSLAYSTELMQGGGRIEGRFLSESAKEDVFNALESLITPDAMRERYGDASLSPLLFAVGDGNHSLATAKTIYEEIKKTEGDAALDHPARYALVEVVNIHDEAMKFEPIYRVVFGADKDGLLSEFEDYISHLHGNMSPQSIKILYENGKKTVQIPHPEKTLPVATLQDFLDGYKQRHGECEIDYIHGESSLKKLSRGGAVGFSFSGMGKDELFKTVIYDGALPRKTFSMGHAEDKRYYLECRKITR